MIVTAISDSRICSISLPEKIAGQYWLWENTSQGRQKLVSVEGLEDRWVLKSNRQVHVLGTDGKPQRSWALDPLSSCMLTKHSGQRIFVLAEPVTRDRQVYAKYTVQGDADLTVGRGDSNDICFPGSAVSSRHAMLSCRGDRWFIQDADSTNGTFVNDIRIQRQELFPGDTVFITGLKIIVGRHMLAMNNPDGQVRLSGKLRRYVPVQMAARDPRQEEYELPPTEYFYRSPRFKRDVETASFKIDNPPASPITEELPWVLVMGTSMTMGAVSLMTLVTAVSGGNIPSMVMGGSMLAGTVLLPGITKAYEKHRKKKKEQLRQDRYHCYLQEMWEKIRQTCALQEQILNENGIPIRECEDRILNRKRNLWERGPGQNDFLRVRLGNGVGRLQAEFSYAERKFSLDDDNLQQERLELCEKEKPLHNIPITCSLFDNPVSGVIGPCSRVREFARGIIMQLAALYSYDEVKFVFLYDQADTAFEFTKWLPHVWSEDRKFRFLATDANQVKEVSAYLERIIEDRLALSEGDMEQVRPYYVIFSMSKELSLRAEMLRSLLSAPHPINMSLVTFYEELRDLPKECTMVVELEGVGGRVFDKDDITGRSVAFTPDIALTQDPMTLSVRLANTPLDTTAGRYQLPGMMTFLEMFGVGKVEHLNALTRWREHDPTKSLEAPVGVDTYGQPFLLDLHEKFHGPHGLVAGMTGSGKSEFIITYILSMAVNYHPDEVAFILIDYKGGGMAKSFEKLPHTAGIITNLDGAAIKRSLVSIESELKRRQAIFAAAGKQIGISNIDIYKYQKLYREGRVPEPLQHLFIISDEFAELKTQQPEFMTQLVSAARIGRSLGIHLILATQKPSGVVDDQIWSNSRFRVCLKVQERSDSMDMLKRPDAAELTDTGRFYLQVGYNELFELGQSAWSGAPYIPSERVVKEKDDSVEVIDANGHVLRKASPGKHTDPNARKQLDAITEYLQGIAREENIHVRPLWLDPIPPVILLEELRTKYEAVAQPFVLEPVIGEYDDPAHQQQHILRLPLTAQGNAVVYGTAGSGKTSFLNAMLLSLIQEHTPDQVHAYILDFGSETLRAFRQAPHVGDVVLSYEQEKVSNLFRMLRGELDRRKKCFADYGGDYESYLRESGKTLPALVVAIHNFAAFTELYPEKEEAVANLSREGTKYGMYFVLTALSTGAVRFRLLQNFNQLLVLQLNDQTEYATVVGKTDGLYPTACKGRGLIRREELYEFQTACVSRDNPNGYIRQCCREAAQSWTGPRAKPIPILPERVDRAFLQPYLTENGLPIGVEKQSLEICRYPLEKACVHLITGYDQACLQLAADLAELTAERREPAVWVLDPLGLCAGGGARHAVIPADCEQQADALYQLVLTRNNGYKTALEQGRQPETYPEQLVFVIGYGMLLDMLSSQGRTKLNLVLEKSRAAYGIRVLLAETVKGLPAASAGSWYKQQLSGKDGIFVGSGITRQYHLSPDRTTEEMRQELEPGFGYCLTDGRAVLVKLLQDREEENHG